jgi:hypothetical protein
MAAGPRGELLSARMSASADLEDAITDASGRLVVGTRDLFDGSEIRVEELQRDRVFVPLSIVAGFCRLRASDESPACARIPSEGKTMVEFCRFLSDFGDSFFRGIQGRLALISLGAASGLALVTSGLRLSESQHREMWGYVCIFTMLTIFFLAIRPRRQRQ